MTTTAGPRPLAGFFPIANRVRRAAADVITLAGEPRARDAALVVVRRPHAAA